MDQNSFIITPDVIVTANKDWFQIDSIEPCNCKRIQLKPRLFTELIATIKRQRAKRYPQEFLGQTMMIHMFSDGTVLIKLEYRDEKTSMILDGTATQALLIYAQNYVDAKEKDSNWFKNLKTLFVSNM